MVLCLFASLMFPIRLKCTQRKLMDTLERNQFHEIYTMSFFWYFVRWKLHGNCRTYKDEIEEMEGEIQHSGTLVIIRGSYLFE